MRISGIRVGVRGVFGVSPGRRTEGKDVGIGDNNRTGIFVEGAVEGRLVGDAVERIPTEFQWDAVERGPYRSWVGTRWKGRLVGDAVERVLTRRGWVERVPTR